MSINATVQLMMNVIEVLDSTDAPAALNPELRHTAWDRSISLTGSTTPPAEVAAEIELSGASGSIDLTALPQIAGTEDCTDKSLVAVLIYNPNTTGRIVLDKGSANGYPVNGDDQADPINIEPGGGAVLYMHDQFPVVSSTVKVIDWTNGGSADGQLILLLGTP